MAYALVVLALVLLFRARIPGWPYYALGHAAVLLVLQLQAGAESRPARRFRDFDMCLHVPVLFLMVCQLVHRIHPVDYDAQLIAIDRAIGGKALLSWMRDIETSFLTRLAKASWIAYYVLPLVPALALYVRADRRAFLETKTVFMLGWTLSYLGYFAVPAQGPGYFPEEVGVPQPKWDAATQQAKAWITAIEGDARDTFPSGHVIVAAIAVFACLRHRARIAACVTAPVALAVTLSTLYLRYHYLVDVLAGLAVAALSAAAGVLWHRARKSPC
jgi:membrane-associated phospholipid phosphatase